MATFANEHEFNSAKLRFYIHNEVLRWLTDYKWIRAAAFLPMAWMVLTACVIPSCSASAAYPYLAAPVSIGLHPMIDERITSGPDAVSSVETCHAGALVAINFLIHR